MFLFGKSVRTWVIIYKSWHTLLFLAEIVAVIWNALVAQQKLKKFACHPHRSDKTCHKKL